MSRLVSKLALLSVLSLIFLLISCDGAKNAQNAKSIEFFAMDTFISIKAYGENAENALNLAKQEVLRIESMFSVTDENSEIYQLNQKKSLELSAEVVDLIAKSNQISQATNGAFDISVYPLVKLYGFTQSDYRVPSDAEIAQMLDFVGYQDIIINGNAVTLAENMSIDLGAIAKGYCADKVAEVLQKNGVNSAIISLGGNIRLLGDKNGEEFSIAVRDPINEQGYIGSINTKNCAVVTSGAYQRYFEENGVKYHHIINSQTGRCADSGLISVTVICADSAVADAVATAFFVAGADFAKQYCAENDDISAVLVDDDNCVSVVGNVDFEPIDNSAYTYITQK